MPKLPVSKIPNGSQEGFDAKSIVKIEDRPGSEYAWFQCDPVIVFPAVIARIREVLKNDEFPNELVDLNSPAESDPRGVARTYLAQAKSLPDEAWKWALQEHDRFYKNYRLASPGQAWPRDTADPAGTQAKIALRAQALDISRLWFTQALHVQAGGDGTPMGVHWINAPAFKS